MQVRELPLNWVSPNYRLMYEEEVIRSLADDIKFRGQQEPIVVEWVGCCFHMVEGEECWRACKKNGQNTIKAIIQKT